MRRIERLLSTVIWLLPAHNGKNRLLRLLGHGIGRNVHLAPNLVIGCGTFTIGDDVTIGAGNVFRNLRRVELARTCYIGRFNQLTAAPAYQRFSDRAGTLTLEERAGITNRHYFDVSGTVLLKKFSAVGGIQSLLQTHEIDIVTNATTVGSIVLGERTLTTTRCLILKNARIPGWSVVAAGSVVTSTTGSDDKTGLYAGVPATWRRELPHCEWWHRDGNFTPVRDVGEL